MGKFLYGTFDTPLPDIYSVYTPEIEAEFPYVVLKVLSWGTWAVSIICTQQPAIKDTDLGLSTGAVYMGCGFVADTKAGLSNGTFPELTEEVVEDDDSFIPSAGIIWTNHAIRNTDGTLYMEKSPNPVPAPQLNPAALMQGFFLGQAIR